MKQERNWEDWVGETLVRNTLVDPPETVLHRAYRVPEHRRTRRIRLWMAVAATLLVVAVGVTWVQIGSAPQLPGRADDTAVRSGEIEVISPVGEVSTIPERLEWESHPDAHRYVLHILAVDDTVLLEESTRNSEFVLPTEFSSGLHRAVRYGWTVDALDESGAVVARSQRAVFEVRP